MDNHCLLMTRFSACSNGTSDKNFIGHWEAWTGKDGLIRAINCRRGWVQPRDGPKPMVLNVNIQFYGPISGILEIGIARGNVRGLNCACTIDFIDRSSYLSVWSIFSFSLLVLIVFSMGSLVLIWYLD